MRGRTVFRAAKPLLILLAAVLALLPRGFVRLLMTLARPIPTRLGIALRYALLRRLARRCGDCVAIHEDVHLFRLERAEFGDNVSVHPMCYLEATGGLTIGSDVSIAHAATILTTEHDYTHAGVAIRDAPVIEAAVAVGNDVWIGAGARILAGVRIGDHAVVGAGAVVTRDVPAMRVVAGVPARVLKSLVRRSGVA
jgi:acetyltransferase-like isoleucine patch superfamily enzyme